MQNQSSAARSKRALRAVAACVAASVVQWIAAPAALAQNARRGSDVPSLEQLLADPRIVDPDALRASASHRRMQIIVNLRETRDVARFSAWRDPRRARAIRAVIASQELSLLDVLPPEEFTLRHRLENQPTFSGEVTLAGLRRLLESSDVETIEPDHEAFVATSQGIALMNAGTVRSLFDGSGMSIAIVDTGIGYNHPALGGGGFPNGKVIGGRDFGDNDNNPLDQNGHGTSVAGVAAGDVIFQGNYIGGVAPGARLYALKIVAGASGSSFDSTIASAWDWCLTHQDDDPSNPILLINTSFSGGLFSSTCNAQRPSLATAASNAVSAGITLFCSAGNDGSCNAIGAGACVTNTIAVGAVYDANIGGKGWCVLSSSCVAVGNGGCSSGFACFDNATAVDQVPCYSNSATILDLLAPSNDATVPILSGGYGDFGGTSAASPYAAGAAAVLIDAARSAGIALAPSDILGYFASTGTTRFDPKSGLSHPRIDLGRAVDALGMWVDFGYVGQEEGTPSRPFNTLQEGIDASPAGGQIFIRAGHTTDIPVFDRKVTLRPVGGTVTIGA